MGTLTMPRVKGLAEEPVHPEGSERHKQSVRYDNLARHLHKILPNYSLQALRRQVGASRLLNRDGSVNDARAERFARALGGDEAVKHLPNSNQAWGRVAEGESP